MKYLMLSHVIWKMNLSPNAFKLYCVCLTFANRANGRFIAKLSTIALRGGLSVRSVVRGITELEAMGLLHKENRYINREHYIASRYEIVRLQGGFTCIPLEAIKLLMNAHAFVIYSYLLKCANKAGKAFPSIRGTAGYIEQSTTTIQKHIKLFDDINIIRKRKIIKYNGSHGNNEYQVIAFLFLPQFTALIKQESKATEPAVVALQLVELALS